MEGLGRRGGGFDVGPGVKKTYLRGVQTFLPHTIPPGRDVAFLLSAFREEELPFQPCTTRSALPRNGFIGNRRRTDTGGVSVPVPLTPTGISFD